MKQRNLTLDISRIIMAILVVSLHGGIFSDISSGLSFITVNGICRLAVPFFFMMNGYFFTKINNSQNLKKWVGRGLTLYIIWTIFYFVVSRLYLQPPVKMVEYILMGWAHLWYLTAMIEACILVYLLRKKQRIGFVLSIVLFLIGVVVQYVRNYFGSEDSLFRFFYTYRNGLFFGVPFCYWGYLLSKLKYNLSISRGRHVALAVVCVCLVVLESLANYLNPSNGGGFDILLTLMIAVPVLFMLALRFEVKGDSKQIAFVATSIYLIHIFCQKVAWHIKAFLGLELGNTLTTIIVIVLSFIASYFLIKINKKLKVIL